MKSSHASKVEGRAVSERLAVRMQDSFGAHVLYFVVKGSEDGDDEALELRATFDEIAGREKLPGPETAFRYWSMYGALPG